MEGINLYLIRFYFPDGFMEGVALIAAQSTQQAEELLNTTGALKDYRTDILEMKEVPGSKYDGEPVVIKEYMFQLK